MEVEVGSGAGSSAEILEEEELLADRVNVMPGNSAARSLVLIPSSSSCGATADSPTPLITASSSSMLAPILARGIMGHPSSGNSSTCDKARMYAEKSRSQTPYPGRAIDMGENVPLG